MKQKIDTTIPIETLKVHLKLNKDGHDTPLFFSIGSSRYRFVVTAVDQDEHVWIGTAQELATGEKWSAQIVIDQDAKDKRHGRHLVLKD